jgi:hypothetical protein
MKVQNGILTILITFCFLISPGTAFPQGVKIDWTSNTEWDLAGYRVYCGTSSGDYQYILDVGINKPVYLKGLWDGIPYHFAVSAYDWAFNESDLSEEVLQTIPADAPEDDLISLSLQPKEVFFQLGTYDPSSSLTLENQLFGIRLDLPEGAADGPVPVAVGGIYSSGPEYFEFDLAPDGFALKKPADVTVPVPFTINKLFVEEYDEDIWLWVSLNDVSLHGNILRFSTQKLGKIRIYNGNIYPDSAQLGGDDSGFSGSGGGGGGCFMAVSADPCAGSPSVIVFMPFLLVAFICVFGREKLSGNRLILTDRVV